MSTKVTIGGDERELEEFNGYKAVLAMDIIGSVEHVTSELATASARFRSEYAEANALVLSRPAARRENPPQVIYRREQDAEGAWRVDPVLQDGQPVMGPDPLGHVSEADWESTGGMLRIPDYPGEDTVRLAMIPKAFKLARRPVFRLLALLVTTNAELEQWDGVRDIDDALDEVGRKLQHDAKADELLELVTVGIGVCREQLAGPFERARAEFRRMRPGSSQQATDETELQPMTAEPEASDDEQPATSSSPGSSTTSPTDTDGTPAPSSTARAGVS